MYLENQYMVIVIFKLVQIVMEMQLINILREDLLVAPLTVAVNIVELLITMGADDFTDFTVAYFVELAMAILERLYLEPGIKAVLALMPKWKIQLRRRFRRNKVLMTREQRRLEDEEWKKVLEEIAKRTEGVEPLLDSYLSYSTTLMALIMSPFVQAFLLLTDTTGIRVTEIPELYGIRGTDLVYYTIFSVLIIPATLAMDMFLFNSLELVHGWRLYDYISYQKYRFSIRQTPWQMHNFAYDESISEGLQSTDNLNFSSQFYFIISLIGYAMFLILMGINIHLRIGWNLFGDPWGLFMVAICWLFVTAMCYLSILFAKIVGLWKMRGRRGYAAGDVDDKLKLGEYDKDLENQRLELKALNSERFRRKFLDKNRPWILQHMAELLTPRTLQSIGPDGRPVVEYIRDVYDDLMKMAPGVRQAGDRGDISSDDSGEDIRMQSKYYSTKPLSAVSQKVLRWWLEKARRRQRYAAAVSGTIERMAEDNQELALDGEAHPLALDHLIRGFEAIHPEQPFDEVLWKAYFRKHATFAPRKDRVKESADAARRAAAMGKRPGAGRVTRAGDVSSDEEADTIPFEPLVVPRTTPAGKLMNKWLSAARKRLGGIFPRPEADSQMRDYVKRMKEGVKYRKKEPKKREEDDFLDEEPTFPRHLMLSAASKAIAQKWLTLARSTLTDKVRYKSRELFTELQAALTKITPENDWFYSLESRQRGEELRDQGQALLDARVGTEATEQTRIDKVRRDYDIYAREKIRLLEEEDAALEKRLDAERKDRETELNKTLAQMRDAMKSREEEIRKELGAGTPRAPGDFSDLPDAEQQELEDMKRKISERKEEGLATIEAHLQQQRDALARKQEKRRAALLEKKKEMESQIQEIQRDVSQQLRNTERDWLAAARRWLDVSYCSMTPAAYVNHCFVCLSQRMEPRIAAKEEDDRQKFEKEQKMASRAKK